MNESSQTCHSLQVKPVGFFSTWWWADLWFRVNEFHLGQMGGRSPELWLHKGFTCPSVPGVSVKMGKGFYISKPVGVLAVILGAGAVATIIALSVVYSQEKEKNINNNVSPTNEATTAPVTTSAPSNEPWDKYRLPKSLVPRSYKVTLRPRLTPDENGLYIFSGKSELSDSLTLVFNY